MSDIADPSALPDTMGQLPCWGEGGRDLLKKESSQCDLSTLLPHSYSGFLDSLSPLPILSGCKGLKASDTFILSFKNWAGLSAEFSLTSCSANFHFLKVVIQRILACQMSHYFPTTLFYCLTL